jgi:NADH-quinone oxidoreductase subunit L
MEVIASFVPLVVILPFVGALINLFLGRYMSEKLIGAVATTAAGLAFAIAAVMTVGITAHGYEATVVNPPLLDSWLYIPSAAIDIPWQMRVDTLSLTMMLVVTGVGTLIHLYAIGYMHGDSRFARFFVYLNLFLAFMLILVTGNNFLMMFVGWEGVGLCSFLLIGFWFDKKHGEGWKNSNAARKAFIVNRVGDFGLLMAIFLIFWTFGTLDYYKPNEVLHLEGEPHSAAVDTLIGAGEGGHGGSSRKGVFAQTEAWLAEGGHIVSFGVFELPFEAVITLITLFMLIGVTGKSAQIPLFVWLPDAMAGPTPVSALIHAATMVTAGVYLITRTSVLYHAAPLSSAIVTIIGIATALMAGFIALGQWDIKKVLAYSTVSQLGFMVAAVGLGGYAAGMFHLITHAFFKALLFLGSGSVIHAMEHGHHHAHAHGSTEGDSHGHDDHGEPADHGHGEAFDPQDMRNMGGLARRMPITFVTYLIGTLALAGIFPLAGFWSKDEILGKAFNAGFNDGKIEGFLALGVLMLAAGFTAFYMWRQIKLVFLGVPRTEAAAAAPESSPAMTIPLLVLAALTIFGGALNVPLGVSGVLVLGVLFITAGFWLLWALPGVRLFFIGRAEPITSPPTVNPIFRLIVLASSAAFILSGAAIMFVQSLGASYELEVLVLWLEHSVPYTKGLTLNPILAIVALSVGIAGILLAQRVYSPSALAEGNQDILEVQPSTRAAFRLSNAKLYWDETYGRLIEQPYNRAAAWLANKLDWEFWHDRFHHTVFRDFYKRAADFIATPVDRGAIDQGFLRIARGVAQIAARLRGVQTGYVRTYVFTMLFGVVLVMLILLLPLLRQ